MLTNRQLFLKHVGQTSATPLMIDIERASGVWMYGYDNERILDLISGIGVSNVGHSHPVVVEAVKKQAEQYMHLMVYGEFIETPQVKLATKLASLLPQPLEAVFFVNSGSEAIEGAMKLAKRYTSRTELIACKDAYHGSTQGALSLNSDEGYKNNFRPLLPDIKQVRFGNIDDLLHITNKTAAFVVETVQGEAGVRTAPETYWQAVRKRCNETGTLLILDEIQCGAGRTGKYFAFEHYNIQPDIVTMAKGMGGGMPIGAFISSNKIMKVLQEDPVLGHITTFGGHPVSCAAALATLEVIEEENLLETVEAKANLFKKLLVHPKIKSIRNKGLMMALEFNDFDQLKTIIDKAIENGVLTDWFLYCDDSMRIAPPLTITEGEIEWACEIIVKSIK